MITLTFVFVTSPSFAATQIYTYKDDSGTPTFTTELDSIPEKYRSRVVPLDSEGSAPSAAGEPSASPAAVQVVTASGDYRMGDHDTRADAIRLAVEAAKRQALEQVATYLESVTEVKNADITRDDIRTYTAGIVTVLNQQISTRLDGQTVVIHADLTAQIDPNEVRQAIAALRENESAKHELEALRAETDQLQQQLAAANQALNAAVSPDQVQAFTQQRQQVLNQLQADALVSQAWTDWVYATPTIYPYPWIGMQQVHALLLQARQLHPMNQHLQIVQQTVAMQAGTLPPAPSGGAISPPPPHASLLVPPPVSQHLVPPSPRNQPAESNTSVSGSHQSSFPAAPAPPTAAPLPPTLHQVHPPHLAQPNPPVLRAPFSAPHFSPPSSPRPFGGMGGHFGGGHHGR